MHEINWLRSHLERCLQDVVGLSVEPDEDGDYLIAAGAFAGYVGLDVGASIMIRVRVLAAVYVPMSAKFAKELNAINGALRSGRMVWRSGAVEVAESILAEGLSRETLRHAIESCFAQAADFAPMLVLVFGGQLPADPAAVDDESAV